MKEINGSHYSINYKIAKLFDRKIEKHAISSFNMAKIFKTKRTLLEQFPNIYAELQGRADGYNVSIDDFIYEMSYELRSIEPDKCTDLYVCDGKEKCIFHNEDGTDEVKLIMCNYGDEKILDLSCYETLSGSTFSATKYLMFSVNSILNDNYMFDGDFPTWIFTRLLLTCKSTNEAFNMIKNISIWGSVSINLLDAKNNKLYSIEKFYKYYSIKEITRLFYKTNLFVRTNLLKYVALPSDTNTAESRYKKMQQLLKSKLLSYRAIMNYNSGDDYTSIRMIGNNFKKSITQATIRFDKDTIEYILPTKSQVYSINQLFN